MNDIAPDTPPEEITPSRFMPEEEYQKTREWIHETMEKVKLIMSSSPKDRLDIVYWINTICLAIKNSMDGFLKWSAFYVYKDFTTKELQDLFSVLKSASLNILEKDADVTALFGDRLNPTPKEGNKRKYA